MLFDHYAGKMKYVCLRYLPDDADAEDALQEGFIKLFLCIDQFSGQGAFEAWMRRIFVNSALMSIRKKKTKKENYTQGQFEDHKYQEDPAEVEENFDMSEIDPDKIDFGLVQKADFTREELLACACVLPDDFKIVFNLYYVEEYKHADIAAVLSIDENTSRTRLSRARKKIQMELYSRSIKKLAIK